MKRYPIVILHGWNLSADTFSPLKKELENRGFSVTCFDLPGFLPTTQLSRPFTIQDYAGYVMQKLDEYKIKEAVVIGHSFGGRIGIYLSVFHPERVKVLVVSGTPALGVDLTIKETLYLFLAKAGRIIFSIWPLCFFSDIARILLYRFVGSYDYYKSSGNLRKTFQNVVSYRLESLLPKISCPTLIIWGLHDSIVPVSVARGMHKLIRDSKMSVIDATHSVPWTHPTEFVDRIGNFMKGM